MSRREIRKHGRNFFELLTRKKKLYAQGPPASPGASCDLEVGGGGRGGRREGGRASSEGERMGGPEGE